MFQGVKNIGIVGNGFVGASIISGFSLTHNIKIYDVDPRRSTSTLEEVVQGSEFIFVSVPTPMKLSDSGKIDLSIINSVFEEISKIQFDKKEKIFILKSTIVPGSTRVISERFPNFNLVFNPEFLTERSAKLDFINSARIILGGKPKNTSKVEEMYRDRFPHKKIFKISWEEAEFIKYMCNCFFAVKVSFMNEMYQASDSLGLDWQSIMASFVADGRIGNSHLQVPGHDGSLGFGGKCFPKDMNAMINFMKSQQIDPLVLEAAWKKNLQVRKNKDWEKIDGATS